MANREKLVDAIISAYHTTRLAGVSAASHVLSHREVQDAFAALSTMQGDDRPDLVGNPECKIASYNEFHEIAVGMGYPSMTEAFEHLSELKAIDEGEGAAKSALALSTLLCENRALLKHPMKHGGPAALDRANAIRVARISHAGQRLRRVNRVRMAAPGRAAFVEIWDDR